MKSLLLLLIVIVLTSSLVTSWVPLLSFKQHQSSTDARLVSPLRASLSVLNQANVDGQDSSMTRRSLLMSSIVLSSALFSTPAHALVKGNAPPSSMKPMTDKPKCTNVEECQAMAEQRQAAERAEMPQGLPPKVTAKGIRYIDVELGDKAKRAVKDGDEVTLYYKVLKLGKRSYDGLSGEGTVVFSRGYGLEDDERAPFTKAFQTTIGSPYNIAALNDAVLDMHIGGIRRFAILPQKGWERPTANCDGGPGGRGAGGDERTDYIIVPTARMVATESCFDTSKQPFPTTYAQERRMAQRFDQSLIMEVQLVALQ